MTYEEWKEHTAIAIYAASFARQYHDHFNHGGRSIEVYGQLGNATYFYTGWR